MRFSPPLFLLVFPLVFISACATSGPSASYDASNDQTVYESATVDVAQMEAAIGSGNSIMMQAIASCSSRECAPERARLVFSVQGQGRVAMADRSISIVADKVEYAKQDASEWNSRDDMSFSEEQIVEVGLSLSAVEQIANASTVSARLGSTPLTLDGNAQEQLQTFLRLIRNPGATSSSSR